MTDFSEFFKKKSNILIETRVFQEDFTPSQIVATNKTRDLISEVAKFTRYKIPNNILVVGDTGTGKTFTAKYVQQYILLLQQRGEIPEDVGVVYINCRNRDAIDIYTTMYGSEVPKTTPAHNVFLNFLVDIQKTGKHLLIILDEVDKGKNIADTLYTLSRPREYKIDFPFNISMVLISNDLKWENTLDPAVRSSLNLKRIEFGQYNVDTLVEILKQKAKIAIKENSSLQSDEILNKIAENVHKHYHSDSRIAVKTLLYLAQRAEEKGEEKLNMQREVNNALPAVIEEVEINRLSLLNQNQFFILYNCVKNKETNSIKQLYEKYIELMGDVRDTPVSRATFYNIIDYLETHDLIEKQERIIALDGQKKDGVKEVSVSVKMSSSLIEAEFNKRTFNDNDKNQ